MTEFPTSSSHDQNEGVSPHAISGAELRRLRETLAEQNRLLGTSMLVRRGDGRIHEATVGFDKNFNFSALWDEVDPDTKELISRSKPISLDAVSPEIQNVLRESLEASRREMGDAAFALAEIDEPVFHGQTVPVSKGNPKTTLGHPSNPNSEQLAAYAAHMKSEGERTVGSKESLDEVNLAIDEIKQSLREMDQHIPAWRYVTAINSTERDNALVKLSSRGKELAKKLYALDQQRRQLESQL